jgi:uncharacterized protein (DUF362 family)
VKDTHDLRVAVVREEPAYPDAPPFDPDEAYPEYRGGVVGDASNYAYRAVRRVLEALGLDRERFGTADWNPLGEVVRPGDRVFVKPNLVTHEYREGCGCPGELFSVITHPSVVRAVADYVAIALDGRGEIIVGDNPCIDANWAELLRRTSLDSLAAHAESRFGVPCRVLDLRPKVTDDLTYYGFGSRTVAQPGDPEGEVRVDLGRSSHFTGMSPLLFRGVFNKRWETIRHHLGDRHEYSISRTIYDSDVYVSVPKLKAHHKVGATLNVKGLVGINYNKNLLIHWRLGYPAIGGDEYATAHRVGDYARLFFRHAARDLIPENLYLGLRRRLKGSKLDQVLETTKRSDNERYRGAWEGNDTCWRMAADLYEAFVADAVGRREELGLPPMRFFSVVDGIVGGEGNGPFCPSAKRAGLVLAGRSLLATDAVAVRLMDFRCEAVRYLASLGEQYGLDEANIEVRSPDLSTDRFFDSDRRHARFRPPIGWPGLGLPNPPNVESEATSRSDESRP